MHNENKTVVDKRQPGWKDHEKQSDYQTVTQEMVGGERLSKGWKNDHLLR